MRNILHNKAWRNNVNKGSEEIAILEIITVLSKRKRSRSNGKSMIAIDMRKVCNGTIDTSMKASNCTQDAGAEIV